MGLFDDATSALNRGNDAAEHTGEKPPLGVRRTTIKLIITSYKKLTNIRVESA